MRVVRNRNRNSYWFVANIAFRLNMNNVWYNFLFDWFRLVVVRKFCCYWMTKIKHEMWMKLCAKFVSLQQFSCDDRNINMRAWKIPKESWVSGRKKILKAKKILKEFSGYGFRGFWKSLNLVLYLNHCDTFTNEWLFLERKMR